MSYDRRLKYLERQRIPQKQTFSAAVVQEHEAMVADALPKTDALSASEREGYQRLENAVDIQSIAAALEEIVYFKNS